MSNVTTRLLLILGVAISASSALGCGSDTPATPQAAVQSSIVPSSAAPGKCSTNQSVGWTIGSGSGDPVPIKDGDNQNGAGVSVQCQVSGNDTDGYNVVATATLAGKGTVSVVGKFTTSRDPQPGITGKFIDASGLGTFSDTQCTVQYIGTNQGIKGGAVWATMTCPNEVDPKSSSVCEGDSVFRFENCSQ